MGFFNNPNWQEAVRPSIAKATLPCTIVEVRDVAGKPRADGSPVMDTRFITLRLEMDAKTTDGDVMKAGATLDIGLNGVEHPNGDTKLETMNRMSSERFCELVIAALKLPPGSRDSATKLEEAGGLAALKDRPVVVDFEPGKGGRNNVNRFAAVAAAKT